MNIFFSKFEIICILIEWLTIDAIEMEQYSFLYSSLSVVVVVVFSIHFLHFLSFLFYRFLLNFLHFFVVLQVFDGIFYKFRFRCIFILEMEAKDWIGLLGKFNTANFNVYTFCVVVCLMAVNVNICNFFLLHQCLHACLEIKIFLFRIFVCVSVSLLRPFYTLMQFYYQK